MVRDRAVATSAGHEDLPDLGVRPTGLGRCHDDTADRSAREISSGDAGSGTGQLIPGTLIPSKEPLLFVSHGEPVAAAPASSMRAQAPLGQVALQDT